MKVGQIVAPRQIEIIDTEQPNLADHPDGTVMIKTVHSAICGTDMPSFILEHPAESYPLGQGLSIHEAIGVVTDSKSDRFKIGDEVLALPRHVGGLSEYFLSDESVTMPLTDFPRKDCILMSQPLGTVVWACRKLPNLLNLDVVVIGQGPMGLLFTHMLSNLGAKTVITTDLVDFRLTVSKKMRATHTINAAKEDPVAAVEEITEGRMADLVVEVVGHQTETINQCLDLLKREGTLLAFGVPDDHIYEFHFADFFRKNLKFIGSVGPDAQNDFPLAMDMIAQGRLDVSPIITHHLPFTEAQLGFEMALNKKDEAIKIVFDYEQSPEETNRITMNTPEYLTIGRARDLILERFKGQNRVPTWQIINHVEQAHCKGVRELSENEKMIVSDALTRRLRTEGLADNPERGYWSFWLKE